MNYVTLIGKMATNPVFTTTPKGMNLARFKLVTIDKTVNQEGKVKSKIEKHELFAWGKWEQVLRAYGTEGLQLAIEGKLVYRFCSNQGKPIKIAEVEVNDLIIM